MKMTLEIMTKILKEKNNVLVKIETFKLYGKKKIEQECGFEIEIRSSSQEDEYILVKKGVM